MLIVLDEVQENLIIVMINVELRGVNYPRVLSINMD